MITKPEPKPKPLPENIPVEGPLPAYETVTLRHIEFTFLGPVVWTVDLTPEDTFTPSNPDEILVQFAVNQEKVFINTRNLLYVSQRPIESKRLVKPLPSNV